MTVYFFPMQRRFTQSIPFESFFPFLIQFTDFRESNVQYKLRLVLGLLFYQVLADWSVGDGPVLMLDLKTYFVWYYESNNSRSMKILCCKPIFAVAVCLLFTM